MKKCMRLIVKHRNPWGQRDGYQGLGEWNGPWSDGSAEWTPYWMKKLNHTFGDDGVFWMSYGRPLPSLINMRTNTDQRCHR